MIAEEVVARVRRTPIPRNNEKDAQEKLSQLLDEMGIRHHREVQLSKGDVVDFMLEGGIAIEMKLKASKRAIHRQLERYCEHPSVKGLILVSGTAMGLPSEIKGKPCWFASLGTGWF